MKSLVAKTVVRYGWLDVAFNNTGVEWIGPLTEATEADYRRAFDANVWGVLAAMKYEIPELIKVVGGAVINTSSIAGQVGMAGVGVYIASKHAVEGLTKSAALEYEKQGVRVTAVAPAAITTNMIDRFVGGEGSTWRGCTRSAGWAGRRRWWRPCCTWRRTPPGSPPASPSRWTAAGWRSEGGQRNRSATGTVNPGNTSGSESTSPAPNVRCPNSSPYTVAVRVPGSSRRTTGTPAPR